MRVKNFPPRPDFFLRSSRNRVNLLSYYGKTTDKREQYDWRADKNWTGGSLVSISGCVDILEDGPLIDNLLDGNEAKWFGLIW